MHNNSMQNRQTRGTRPPPSLSILTRLRPSQAGNFRPNPGEPAASVAPENLSHPRTQSVPICIIVIRDQSIARPVEKRISGYLVEGG